MLKTLMVVALGLMLSGCAVVGPPMGYHTEHIEWIGLDSWNPHYKSVGGDVRLRRVEADFVVKEVTK